MRARAVVRCTAALQVFLLMATLVLPALAAATEISTDLWVYQDGDTVTVTGIDFGANETVDLVTTDPLGAVVDAGSASTNETGGFTYQFILSATVDGIYDIVATGQTSGFSATTQFDPGSVTYTDLGGSTVWKQDGQTITFAGTFTCQNSGSSPRCTSVQSITIEIYQSNGLNGVYSDAGHRVASFAPSTPASFPVSGTSVGAAWSVTKTIGSAPVALPDGEYEVRVKMTFLDNAPTPALQNATDATNANPGGAEFGIDNVAPDSTINAPSIDASDIDPSGGVSDATSGPASVDVALYAGACPGTTFLDSDTDPTVSSGSWSVNNLAGGGFDTPGTFCIRSTATDKAGLVQASPTTREYIVDAAPEVASTNPTGGATDVDVESDIVVTFDEDVTLDANAITVECPATVPHLGVTTGSGTTWTFNPTADLPPSTVCVVTVHSAQVHDVDANDPPDEMDNPNTTFSFTTAAPVPANTAPSVDAGGPYSGDEGSPISLDGYAFDAESDPLTYFWEVDVTGIDPLGACLVADPTALDTTITCDDDSNGGTFTMTLTVSGDPGGPVSDTATLSVGNVAPTVALDEGNPVSVTESNILERTYAYVASDAGANDVLTSTPSCGDYGTYVAASDNGSSFKCKFLDGGPTPPGTDSDVTIYVTDDEDADSSTDTQTVNISNANPVVAMPTWANTTIDCQTSATLTGLSFSDAGINDAPWSMDIDWDDGDITNVSPIATQGAQSNQPHLYTTPGTYVVTLDVTDKDGGVGDQTVGILTVEQTYTVRFLSPFDASSPYELVNNTMKAGRVVPVKVTIYDDCAQQYVTDPATLVKLHLGTNPSGPAGVSDAVEVYADAGASNSNTLYFRFNADATRADGGFWIFNLDSRTALNGSPFVVNATYRIDIYVGPSPGVLASDDEWALLKAVK